MKLSLKLFASLTDYLPLDSRVGNRVELEVDADTTINQIIDTYRLPVKLVHLVLVNGVYVAPDQRATRTLVDGDVLAMWPPIAGG